MTFLKLPKIDRKSKKQVGWYYQFRLYNPKSRRTEPVPVALLPTHIRECSSDEVAQTYCDKKNTEEERVRHRSKMRIAWIKKHYDFTKLLDNFTVAHQVNAPNSWESTVHYLNKFVFHFFLDHMEANNIGNWSLYFDDFRRWLQTTKPLKYGKSKLAYSTMNGCIKALNVFLNWTATTRQGQAVAKCPVFPRHMLRVIGAEDVLDNSEIKLIYKKLLNIRKISAELYLVLANTGMRINESLGLSLAFLHEGNIEGPKAGKIHRILRKYDLRYYGFICLESQPSLSLIRDAEGKVPRKPLKTKKAIHPKDFRYIPILKTKVWNILAQRWNKQNDAFRRKVYGSEKRDYLLFDGLTAAKFYSDLMKAHQKTKGKVRFRSPHKLRHTYLTWFYDKTNDDTFLAERVVGHRDRKTMENYSHLAEQIGNEVRNRKRFQKKMKIFEID